MINLSSTLWLDSQIKSCKRFNVDFLNCLSQIVFATISVNFLFFSFSLFYPKSPTQHSIFQRQNDSITGKKSPSDGYIFTFHAIWSHYECVETQFLLTSSPSNKLSNKTLCISQKNFFSTCSETLYSIVVREKKHWTSL